MFPTRFKPETQARILREWQEARATARACLEATYAAARAAIPDLPPLPADACHNASLDMADGTTVFVYRDHWRRWYALGACL